MPTTGHIGRIAVVGESSIGSGVRRIDALVGDGAYGYQAKEHALVSQLSTMVGGRPEDLPERVEGLLTRLKDAEKRLAAAEQAALAARTADIVAVGAVLNSRPVVVVATNGGARDQGIRAGALVRTAAQALGGGGGGKDDLAQGGGQNPEALDEALSAVADQIKA